MQRVLTLATLLALGAWLTACGGSTTAAGGSIGIGDSTNPTVSLTQPSDGATVTGTITIAATASDNVAVTRVEFRIDGGALATDTTAPYSTSWDTTTVANATHSVSAVAFDAAGNSATATVSVTVNNAGGPPPLTITPSAATVDPSTVVNFTIAGGVTPYSTDLQAGQQPSHGGDAPGGAITLNATTGVGTYTTGATGSVTDLVRFADSLGTTVTLTVTVNAAPPTGGIDPSGGSGGTYPGDVTRTATVGATTRSYYLHIPPSYTPGTAMPILYVYHGAGGPTYKGQWYRDFWAATADANDFIVLGLDSLDDVNGGWSGNDINFVDASRTLTLGEYNIEQAREYIWGFSAGGHFAHAVALSNSTLFAAYAVHSGVTQAFGVTPSSATRKIPVGLWIGDSDPNLPFVQQDRDAFIAAGWTLGTDLSYNLFTGGHTVPNSHRQPVWDFLKQWTRP